MHFMYNLMYNLMYFDVQTAGVHWCQCSLGRSGAKAPPGALKRAIFSKNFLQDKGSISDKESISDKGSISDKESISYIISLRIAPVLPRGAPPTYQNDTKHIDMIVIHFDTAEHETEVNLI